MTAYQNIILSGLPGAGKSVLAKELVKIYHWESHSVGSIFKDRWREKYPHREVSFDQYWGNCSKEENLKIDEQTRRVLEGGHIVGDFRYAILAGGIDALQVFVTADLETRARRYLGSDKNNLEIKETLRKREEDEVRVGKELYGLEYDYRESSQYDIVLNSARLTLEQEIGQIQRLMRQVGRAGLEPAIDTV